MNSHDILSKRINQLEAKMISLEALVKAQTDLLKTQSGLIDALEGRISQIGVDIHGRRPYHIESPSAGKPRPFMETAAQAASKSKAEG